MNITKSCFSRSLPFSVSLGDPECEPTVEEVSKVQKVSSFTSLLTLKQKVAFSKCLVPICPWLDEDKIPFDIERLPSLRRVLPYHHYKCEEVLTSDNVSSELGCGVNRCAQNCSSLLPGPLQAVLKEGNVVVPYLVGFEPTKTHCNDNDGYGYATRTYFFEKISSIADKLFSLIDE